MTFEKWFSEKLKTHPQYLMIKPTAHEIWQASREALWNKLRSEDFIVMGAQATQSATTENEDLWVVYWRTIDLLKEKLSKERE